MTSTAETYNLLVSLLSKCPQTIEILPGDGSIWMPAESPTQNLDDIGSELCFSPFLFVEGNLGIPKKILYKVYLHAVGVFKAARGCVPMRHTIAIQPNPDIDASLIRVLADSTAILLLANPSHQTALNTRKHLVRTNMINPHAELRFTASMLSSRDFVKHAELWYHRRWLIGVADDSESLNTTATVFHGRLQFQSQEALRHELQLVSRACELYPRNYFAWAHRLICVRTLLSDHLTGTGTIDFHAVFRNEIIGIKKWIDCHVSDYSAIHTVLTLSQVAFQSGDSALVEIVIEEDLLEHAISLVQEYPSHEALWMYIQAAHSILNLLQTQWQTQRVQEFMDHFVQPLLHSQPVKIGIEEDIATISQYARGFLERNKFKFSDSQYA